MSVFEISGVVFPEHRVSVSAFVAVTGNGSWGGPGKTHAADPATAENRYERGVYYRSLCGELHLHGASIVGARTDEPAAFADLPSWTDRCKRCIKILQSKRAGL